MLAFGLLPPELQLYALVFCDYRELSHMSCTCKEIAELMKSNFLWSSAFEVRFRRRLLVHGTSAPGMARGLFSERMRNEIVKDQLLSDMEERRQAVLGRLRRERRRQRRLVLKRFFQRLHRVRTERRRQELALRAGYEPVRPGRPPWGAAEPEAQNVGHSSTPPWPPT